MFNKKNERTMKKERIYEISLYDEKMRIIDVIVDGFSSRRAAFDFAKSCVDDLDDVSFYEVIAYPTCYVKYLEDCYE